MAGYEPCNDDRSFTWHISASHAESDDCDTPPDRLLTDAEMELVKTIMPGVWQEDSDAEAILNQIRHLFLVGN